MNLATDAVRNYRLDSKMRAFEPWQLKQLERIAQTNPDRLEELLQALWNRYPFLYEELVIASVDQGHLSEEDAASRMSVPVAMVNEKLEHFHNTGDHRIDIVGGVARLVSSHVAVWEVYRDFEESGSLDHLMETFPGIPISELKAAIRYAEAHMDEIRDSIARYEAAYTNRYVG